MADGLLRGAASLLRKPELMNNCAQLLDQAANHLLKADLTFERLSDRFAVQQMPQDAPTCLTLWTSSITRSTTSHLTIGRPSMSRTPPTRPPATSSSAGPSG
jgi:hypothetical protein